MRTQVEVHDFLNPRKNGETQYEITSELCDNHPAIEVNQFAGITAYNIKKHIRSVWKPRHPGTWI